MYFDVTCGDRKSQKINRISFERARAQTSFKHLLLKISTTIATATTKTIIQAISLQNINFSYILKLVCKKDKYLNF